MRSNLRIRPSCIAAGRFLVHSIPAVLQTGSTKIRLILDNPLIGSSAVALNLWGPVPVVGMDCGLLALDSGPSTSDRRLRTCQS